MKADVYVELPSAAGAQPRIAIRKGGRIEEIGSADLRANGQTKVVAFAPALAVARFRVPITTKAESEARRAALYAIEDDLAQPVEDVVVTLAPRLKAQAARDVYVVDKSMMDQWAGLLQRLGLGHATIVPENSFRHADATIVNFGDRFLLGGPDMSMGADGNLPQDAVDALIDAAGFAGARTIRTNSLTYLGELYERDAGVSLANSGSQFSRRGGASAFQFWRLTGVLGIAAIALWIASIWTEGNGLGSAAVQNEAAARVMFREQFPDAPEPVDIHAEVRRLAQQGSLSGREGFRPLSNALYEAIAGSETIQLINMSYTEEAGVLNANLLFANRADEASFGARLEAAGWRVETIGARDLPQGVEANIVVRAGQ